MGVPTLTLAGETPASRQGCEVMKIYGLKAFITCSREEYLTKALYWQDNLEQLNVLRLGMRSAIPVERDATFNAETIVEKALCEAWRRYCAGEQPAILRWQKTMYCRLAWRQGNRQ